ncbi:WecB/TagA/CpsF family glycosyltransferase [Calorimonas adulescens]|jgi:N-acetylmannosaminyltransferase (EC 2.4.1.187)|uniref:N-acetylglucosaminyldiphosphoundecaprenol N-acetyl-beta-D-mannosaminyltransferase n=1 Tax=Calorimonas adulescens TaxID=2606906 RepID=A0A5D8Q932_9THEO|nr:WecB/TagA/CpsF family glycosyltransferase [Calorimonas adulescens]TZE81090.1 WecB/TagA/CpsF family glycosyltransferase [Calorimonas adulescens]
MEKVEILNIRIDNVTMDEAYRNILVFLKEDRRHIVYTPNAEIIMAAQRDRSLVDVLNFSDLNVPDGIGVVMASRLYGCRIKERVAGFDLMNYILKNAPAEGYSVYFLGGKPGVAEKAAKKAVSMYGEINIAGFHDGYFDRMEEKRVIEEINSRGVDFLFVGLGAPKQERWIYEHPEIKAKVIMGVGGSFDVLAGVVKRAPEIYQKFGLEWLYRLIQEPWRYRRMMSLPLFVLTVIKDRIGGVLWSGKK